MKKSLSRFGAALSIAALTAVAVGTACSGSDGGEPTVIRRPVPPTDGKTDTGNGKDLDASTKGTVKPTTVPTVAPAPTTVPSIVPTASGAPAAPLALSSDYEGCGGCHGAQGEGDFGPRLLATKLSEQEYLEIVQNGRGAMPKYFRAPRGGGVPVWTVPLESLKADYAYFVSKREPIVTPTLDVTVAPTPVVTVAPTPVVTIAPTPVVTVVPTAPPAPPANPEADTARALELLNVACSECHSPDYSTLEGIKASLPKGPRKSVLARIEDGSMPPDYASRLLTDEERAFVVDWLKTSPALK